MAPWPWQQISTNHPGVLLAHCTYFWDENWTAELVVTGMGALQIRVNGKLYGGLITDCTIAQGKKRYQRALQEVVRLRQTRLSI